MKLAYRYWMKFVYGLGWVNSRIILFVLYVLLIGIYAFFSSIVKLLRKDGQRVGWLSKKYEKPNQEVLKRQF